jgi:uncharacterized repeat protein (TIGR03987 family)
MLPLAKIAATVVSLALISYSIAIITEQRRRKVIDRVLIFLTLGVVLDVSATTMMIIVSENSPFTLHGILGYSSLTLMLIDAVLLWRFRVKTQASEIVPKPLHLYSRIAYIWWVAAYITGTLMVMLKS